MDDPRSGNLPPFSGVKNANEERQRTPTIELGVLRKSAMESGIEAMSHAEERQFLQLAPFGDFPGALALTAENRLPGPKADRPITSSLGATRHLDC
jgi:hypothetical protein